MVAHRADLVERLTREVAAQARQATADELINVLAHDMRNYITPVLGNIGAVRELLRQGEESGEGGSGQIAEYVGRLDAAYAGAQRLQVLVGDLLDSSRLERGLLSLSKEPVDLVALVREIARVMETPRSNITQRLPDRLVVEADATRIRQALENLVSNALLHGPEGVPVLVTLRLEIDTAASEADQAGETSTTGATGARQEWATVTVKDEGPGIAPDLLPTLFTRFARGGESKGLGLGLYLAQSIAQAHGGSIAVEPGTGAGETFTLRLPVTGG
jgi:two-component system, OmpR family, sensor kinase